MNIALFLKILKQAYNEKYMTNSGIFEQMHKIMAANRIEFFKYIETNIGNKSSEHKNTIYYEITYKDPNAINTVLNGNKVIIKPSNLKTETGYVQYLEKIAKPCESTSDDLFEKDIHIKVTLGFFKTLFGTSHNNQKMFTLEDFKMPPNLKLEKQMVEKLFYTFFQLPLYLILDSSKETLDGSLIDRLYLWDLILQDSFCNKIMSRIHWQSDANSDSSSIMIMNQIFSTESNVLFENYVKLFIVTHNLSGLLKNAIKSISSQDESIYVSNGQALMMASYPMLSKQYMDFLSQLLQLAYTKNKKRPSNEKKINLIERMGFVAKQDNAYKPLLETICAISALKEEKAAITLSTVKNFYAYFADQNGLPTHQLDQILTQDCASDLLLFKLMFDAAFEINSIDKTVSIIRPDETNFHDYVLENTHLQGLYLPNDFILKSSNNKNTFHNYCLGLYNTLNYKTDNNLDLSTHELSTFTDGRLKSAFTIDPFEAGYSISVDLNPIIRGGIQVNAVPRWAGIFYSLKPSFDLSIYNFLKFEIRSHDSSVDYVQLEIKNDDPSRKEHKVPLSITNEWHEFVVPITQIPEIIVKHVEEICFVVSPASITQDSLIGRFDIKQIKFFT